MRDVSAIVNDMKNSNKSNSEQIGYHLDSFISTINLYSDFFFFFALFTIFLFIYVLIAL